MIPTQSIRKTAFWLGLSLPSFALLATIWVTHVTNGQFSAAFASVTQTYNVLNILEQTQAQIADAETGQRGYLLTSRPDYFSLHDTAMAAINNDIQKLKILVRGNPIQETNLAELQSLIAKRLGPNPDTLDFSKARSTDAMAVALTDQGRDTINQSATCCSACANSRRICWSRGSKPPRPDFFLTRPPRLSWWA